MLHGDETRGGLWSYVKMDAMGVLFSLSITLNSAAAVSAFVKSECWCASSGCETVEQEGDASLLALIW